MPDYAIKEKVAEGFTAAGERMDDTDTNVEQMQKQLDILASELKLAKHLRLSAQDESYQGFWDSSEHAKEFGEIILSELRREPRRKAMGEGTQTGGGAVVPVDLASWLIQKLGKYGKFRFNVLVVQLGTDTTLVPKVESDLTVYCPGEGKEITLSDMSFGQVGLTPKKFACIAKVSSELDEDSVVALGEILGLSISRSMAKKEDLIGFIGDGTSAYFGMTGIVGALRGVDEVIANIKGLVVAAGNAYGEITLANFREVIAILPDDADANAKWYMSKKFYFSVVYPLAETAGVANIFEILSDRKSKYFLGYEVVFVSAMPSAEANSQICAILGDLQLGAYLGERKELTIVRSDQVFFQNDQIAVRGLERVAINAYGVGDTTEPGAIVGLITAAS